MMFQHLTHDQVTLYSAKADEHQTPGAMGISLEKKFPVTRTTGFLNQGMTFKVTNNLISIFHKLPTVRWLVNWPINLKLYPLLETVQDSNFNLTL